jgi:hypothetical protein
MQSGRAAIAQLLAQVSHNVLPKGLDGGGVVAKTL